MRLLSLAVPIFFGLLALSCKGPELQPELRDPIFQDLVTQSTAAEKALADAQKKVVGAHVEFSKAAPQVGEVTRLRNQLFEAQREATKAEQLLLYRKAQIKLRRVAAREAYLNDFFGKRIGWPDPNEYSTYKAARSRPRAPQRWSETYSGRLAEHQESLAAKKRAPASAH